MHRYNCTGTGNLAQEIISNAISAGTRDPRFLPVEEKELPYLEYSVDVLKEAEQIDSLEQLDVRRYGVIVSDEHRRGLLLPDLEGWIQPLQQISIALNKAGMDPDEPFLLERLRLSITMSAVCELCPHNCRIPEGKCGFCGVRTCRNGRIVSTAYGKISSMALDPIEKKPLRRFHPGSQIMSIGSMGCNMRCPVLSEL